MKLAELQKQKIERLKNDMLERTYQLGSIELMLQDLQNEKLNVINSIDELRVEESEFILNLTNEYGIGELDIETMEWNKK